MSQAKAGAAHPHEKPHHPHWPLAVLLFTFVALLGLLSVHVPGTWLHVKTGARIVGEHALPRVDAFSYTAAGRPWTTDSWLSDALFYSLHAEFGPAALVWLKALCVAAAFALLLPVNPAAPLIAATVLGLGALSAWPGMTETPGAFDFLLLAGMLRLLRPRRGFHWSMLAQVGALEMLWANLNGTTAVLGLWLVALKVFKASMRTAKRERVGYWVLLFVAAAALACNPQGFSVIPHMFDGAESWAAWRPISPWVDPYFLFAAGGAAACWIVLQQEFFLTISAATLLALSLLYQGLRPLYLLAVCPVITLALGHALRPKDDTPARVARWAVGLVLALAGYVFLITLPLSHARGYSAVSLEGALHFLRDNGVKGRMFNEPESGPELLAADRAVFVDWRAGLYGAAFMKDARRWPTRFRQLSDIYHFDYAVILNRRGRYPAKVLDDDPDWRLSYADDDALVYLRRSGDDGWLTTGQAKPLVEPNRLWPDAMDAALSKPKTASKVLAELDRWLVQAPDSVEVLIWKAYALERLNLPEKAERLCALVDERPRLGWDPELEAAFGAVQEKRGDLRRAKSLFLRASLLARRRGDAGLEAAILERLAGIYRRTGEEPRARELDLRREELSARAAGADS